MKTTHKIAAIIIIFAVLLAACEPSDSIPSEKKIKSDLVNSGQAYSVEKIEITDTTNQKSTIGSLMITANIDYTNNDMESEHRDNVKIFYDWTDNDGWKLVTSVRAL